MNDLNGYLKRMGDAVDEKLMFINFIDLNWYDVIFDFGCADGSILARIRDKGFEGTLVGYDKNWQMLEIGKERYANKDITFISGALPTIQAEKSLVFIGSVFHEVIDPVEIMAILHFISKFETVVIRDMYFNFNPITHNALQRNIDYKKIKKHSPYYKDFENVWGDIERDARTLYHYLLKYHYDKNWETENKEYYFNTRWDLISDILETTHLQYFNRVYKVQYIVDKVKKDFGYEMVYPTHRTVIYRNRESVNKLLSGEVNKHIT